jgi:hypothetical protein
LYLAAVNAVTHAQVALPKSAEVDSGFTAADLDAMDGWNAGQPATKGEFGKLSKPYSDAKPGKLAYALEYKRARPGLTGRIGTAAVLPCVAAGEHEPLAALGSAPAARGQPRPW